MPGKSTATSKKSIYSVHSSIAYAQTIIRNLPETTGKSIEEWVALVKKSGPNGEKERREWLKKNYQLGGTTVSMIVDRVEGKGAEDTDPAAYLKAAEKYVEAMYAGPKAALRPIEINSVADIDAEVKDWLKIAYDLDA